MPRRVVVEWRGGELEANSLEQLDVALDHIAADRGGQAPCLVNVYLENGDSLSIALASEYSMLDFARAGGEEPFMVSLGDRDALGIVELDFQGQLTEYPRWACIPPALARDAIRYFFETGELSPKVTWLPSSDWASMP
jgi:hypothetical protein